ncbi:hypothetical protein ACU4GD_41370 [Cupriavidus basilensis]
MRREGSPRGASDTGERNRKSAMERGLLLFATAAWPAFPQAAHPQPDLFARGVLGGIDGDSRPSAILPCRRSQMANSSSSSSDTTSKGAAGGLERQQLVVDLRRGAGVPRPQVD